MKGIALIAASPLLLVLSGCLLLTSTSVRKPDEAAVKQARAPKPHTEGSLWEDNSRSTYFTDSKASGVGDILTVKILEVSKGSDTAGTNTNRDSSIDASVTNLFGLAGSLGLKNLWGKGTPFDLAVKGGMKNDYKGAGDTTREQTVTGTISVLVVDVTPAGNLVVAGKREIGLNKEKEVMVMSGVVRPEDVAADNSVFSTQIAEARIVYSGSGVISDKQGPGWLTRVLDYVWPF